MSIITFEDFRDVYIKALQRGSRFVLSKFQFQGKERTKSSFNVRDTMGLSWWTINEVKQRWNQLITGDHQVGPEVYLTNYLAKEHLRVVSLGSGGSDREIHLAQLNPTWTITCVDFSEVRMDMAQEKAQTLGLTNISFQTENIYEYPYVESSIDVIMFHSSLHHVKNIKEFIPTISGSLTSEGLLIIDEYVGPNRLQYSSMQLKAINDCLDLLPSQYKRIYKTHLIKNRYYGSGLLRMILADPSECIDSTSILPTIHEYFEILKEKNYGGSLLMPALKDISHHFNGSAESNELLQGLFQFEDDYLSQHPSDFVYGIYQVKG